MVFRAQREELCVGGKESQSLNTKHKHRQKIKSNLNQLVTSHLGKSTANIV
jgi:hypothetical protein